MPHIINISPKEVHEKRNEFTIIDVRSDEELAIVQLPGAIHIPITLIVSDFADQVAHILELEKTHKLAFMCHHGGRSRQAATMLLNAGLTSAYNIEGGIDQWSLQVDPTLALYK